MFRKWDPDSLAAQVVKSLPAMPGTQVQFLGREDPLEKGMAAHSSILAWRIPWTEEPGGLQSVGSQRVRHDRATSTLTFHTLLGVSLAFVSSRGASVVCVCVSNIFSFTLLVRSSAGTEDRALGKENPHPSSGLSIMPLRWILHHSFHTYFLTIFSQLDMCFKGKQGVRGYVIR